MNWLYAGDTINACHCTLPFPCIALILLHIYVFLGNSVIFVRREMHALLHVGGIYQAILRPATLPYKAPLP